MEADRIDFRTVNIILIVPMLKKTSAYASQKPRVMQFIIICETQNNFYATVVTKRHSR